jgi:hypothetical protein
MPFSSSSYPRHFSRAFRTAAFRLSSFDGLRPDTAKGFRLCPLFDFFDLLGLFDILLILTCLHPLEARLSRAFGQQGAEPKAGLFCILRTVR